MRARLTKRPQSVTVSHVFLSVDLSATAASCVFDFEILTAGHNPFWTANILVY